MARTDSFATRLGWVVAFLLCVAGFVTVANGSAQVNDWIFRSTTLVMLAVSWNLMANGGLISLGHSAFWGVGSYAAVLSMNAMGLPFALALVPATLTGALLGIFLAATTGRLSGIFFAIATLALSEGLRVLALMIPELTGGAEGLFIKGQLRPTPHILFLMALGGAILCVLCAYILSRSRYHFALRGMRNDEASVQMLGVDPMRFRMGIVAISGAMASLAGAMATTYGGYIDPEIAFTLHNTISAQIAPILGGLYTVTGPVVGSFAVVFLSEATRIWLGTQPGLSLLIFGLILALCIRFMPLGIVGLLASLRAGRRAVAMQVAAAHRDANETSTTKAVEAFGSRRDAADAVLIVDAIKASYGDSLILESVSFDVGRGEVVCLLGANGAGKTTTMKALTGLIPVQSGAMTFLGRDLCAMPSDARVAAGLALSPEARQVFPTLTVMENLLLGSYSKAIRAKRRDRLDLVFEIFPKLQERESQRAGLMSGGEQQMLAIGRALMCDPKLLLLDEPSLGLSPKLVQSTFEAIDRVAKTGISVLMVEQNTYAALSISQRGYVLAEGRIVAAGSAAQLSASSIVQQAFLGKQASA